ncbi:MAG: hypothetical protein JXR96_22865 [Deltaproteobacteria bacterium]|nr:hypothetical protein [Deltaproteobacteria bacterium]
MKKIGLGFFIALCAAVPLVIIFLVGGFGSGEVTGELRGSGPLVGTFSLAPDACGSGQSDGFVGVYLGAKDRSDARLKVFQDPAYGEMVLLQIPGSCEGPRCKQVLLKRDHCERLSVRIEKTNTTINDVRVLDGELSLKCKLASGDAISGELRFEGCH